MNTVISWIIADEVVLKSAGLILGGSILLAFLITVGIQLVKGIIEGVKYLIERHYFKRMGEYDKKHK
jgi:hypothetical protein